ncbi:hypothetical protein OCV51_12290 [Faecalicatena acetigenes]|uniref:Uncharacterized protein n=1 Tax=Faecalicatena acetigenes TaxID=2981790 RepID=A0ABT2TDR4_9FIRM|nr:MULTISPECIES: hypothetical protein [Lachnospiraceae]MCU6748425.1 hypothetical protein [Faecalicatena acetigenes]SCI43349.1 Uncharacterised protein [uncultured Clostridium sp.]
MEYKKEPDFICDPVPYNVRIRYEQRKGKYKAAAIIFAESVMLIGILLLRLPQIIQTGEAFWQQAAADLILLIAGTGILWTAAKWQGRRIEREYGKRIEAEKKGWFSGTFYPEFLLIETKAGEKQWYYYNDISGVKETGEAFCVLDQTGELDIPKMYLKRDAVRSIRHQFMRYCKECYEQYFEEDTEGLRLEILPDPVMCAEKSNAAGRTYFQYAAYRRQTYFSEAKIWGAGGALFYLISMAALGSEHVSKIGKAGCLFLVGFGICIRVVQMAAAKISWKKAERRRMEGEKLRLEIGKEGVYLQRKGLQFRKTWKQIRQIYEGKDFFVLGNVYIGKYAISEEDVGQLRAVLQRYAGRKYVFIDIDGIREERKTFLLLLVYACVVGAVLTGYTYFAGSVQTQMGESAGYQDDRKNFGAEKGQAGEMGDKQPVYVQTPDMYALNLTMTDIYINDCYSSNETNEESRFYIGADNILYGASANHNGELGLGDTQEYMTAKGFYREMEVAQNVKHVALGEDFMVYINDKGELFGTGNLPAAGSSYIPVLLLEDVQYAKCSNAGLIALKEDGSVWCAGTLYDESGNSICSYDGFEEVMEHASFVTAGRYVMAVIRTDGSLWMWGDNARSSVE